MRLLLLCFIFSSCSIKNNPKDFSSNNKKTNWVEIHRRELISSAENGDVEAWLFFFPEYLKELNKL